MHYSCFVKYNTVLEYPHPRYENRESSPTFWLQAAFLSMCPIRTEDPIFSLATPLRPEEVNSCTREVIGHEDCLPDPVEQAEEATAVQGGWFGRGYGKGRKKKKLRNWGNGVGTYVVVKYEQS